MKTVRFAHVVERSGRPHVHALWVAPESGPEFQRARKGGRVMTIESTGHGKADVGVIGFDRSHQRGGQILIFPKSLKPFEGTRVVGVKFDLVDQPPMGTAGQAWTPPPRKTHAKDKNRATSGDNAEPTTTGHAHPDGDDRGRNAPAIHGRGARATRSGRATKAAPSSRPRSEPPAAPRQRKPRERKTTSADPALLAAVRAALEELREGKAVAAYQRLERAAAEAEAD